MNAQDDTKQSAYLISTSEGYLELLRLTLRAGADVRSTDSYNGTGLIRAADRGHVEIIRELLKTDIKIDHVNRLGWTALLEAIILGDGGARHTEVVRLLVEAGADVNLADAERSHPAGARAAARPQPDRGDPGGRVCQPARVSLKTRRRIAGDGTPPLPPNRPRGRPYRSSPAEGRTTLRGRRRRRR